MFSQGHHSENGHGKKALTEFAPYNKPYEALRAVIRFGAALVEHPSDFLVLLFLADRTAGWQKASDTASLRQFVAGIRRQDGRKVRSGCGLPPATVKRALARLEKRGLLVRERRRRKRAGDVPTEHRIVWKRVAEMIESASTPVAHGEPPRGSWRATPVAHGEPHSKQAYSKQLDSKSASQPAVNVVAVAGATKPVPDDRLAGLLLETWNHLTGTPGAKLLVRIAETLGDTPLEQFHELLMERQAKARSFGLALDLAGDARKRWESGAAEPITRATPRKPAGRQESLVERTEALIAKRLAKGERPV